MATLTQFTNLEDSLTALRTKWESTFTSDSVLIEALREAVIAAECTSLHSRAAFQQFHLLTEAIGEPMHEWEPAILARFTFLKRQQALDNRSFTLSLNALREAAAAESMSTAKQSQTPVPSPPVPVVAAKVIHYQHALVTVTDGKVDTSVDLDAAFWCRKQLWGATAYFIRHIHFQGGIVPESYAYVLTHQGVSSEPSEHFSTAYSPREFARLCQLELDSGSNHLLDGTRLAHSPSLLVEVNYPYETN